MIRPLLPLLLLAMTACGVQGEPKSEPGNSNVELDRAAIDAGILPDPKMTSFGGAYERTTELGFDRFCAVAREKDEYQVGFYASFGTESHCTGRGKAKVSGSKVSLTLGRTGSCAVEGSFDGQILRFDGKASARCAELCSQNAVLAGVSFPKVSDDRETALALTGRDGNQLCGLGRSEPAAKANQD